MLFIDAMVERQILDAQREGQFDKLAGAGKPLVLDDDSQVPEALRLSFRILKMSGFLPAEIALRNDAISLHYLLLQATDEEQRLGYQRQLSRLKDKLQLAGLSTDFLNSVDYGLSIGARLIKK